MEWLAEQEPARVFITAITQAEILHGIEGLPAGKRRQRLLAAVENMHAEVFRGRILAFDAKAAREFAAIVPGRDRMGRPIAQFDAMIAAIARSCLAAVATRNTADFQSCGVDLIDPWTA